MDYEKKYKEALENARQEYNITKNVERKQWLEELFPELRELSEDEKIRKELLSFCQNRADNYPNDPKYANISNWISWLEKQKEPELSKDLGEYVAELSKQFPEVSFAKLSRIAVRVKKYLEKQGERKSDIRYKYLDELLTADDIYQMSMNEAMTNEAKIKAVNALSNLCISKLLGLEKQGEKDRFIKNEIECIKGYRENAIKKLEELEKQGQKKCIDDLTQQEAMDIAVAKCFEQGEQKPITIDIDKMCDSFAHTNIKGYGIPSMYEVDAYRKGINDALNLSLGIEKQGEQKVSYTTLVETGNGGINALVTKELPTNGCDDEQKPSDKIEPKFKVGDKIRRKISRIYDKDMQVARIGKDYYLCNNLGKFSSEQISFSEESNYELVEHEPACSDNKKLTDVNHEYFSELLENDDSKDINDYAYQVAYCMSHDWIKETATWDDVQIACKLGAEWNEKHHESAEWSEEDEHRVEDTIYFLDTAKKHYASTEELDACIDWLKSLKDRVQPQPKKEWSEEDEVKLEEAICMIEANGNWVRSEDAVKDISNWLKSLKDRVQPIHEYSDTEKQEIFIRSQRPHFWRPSDEQMYHLKSVVDCSTIGWNVDILESLYNDLKKLKA